ncbi:para-aminobenzoate synthase [Pontibacillus halophilus JSM 076056 = DSM 19796]|uniref:Para-aminobenzoate synthase n=1 Tax=Pontibacillus halophilus JSM 076056 = DSM 19796 TaxID=1385510 RepID=A0A0A5GDN3_9BACI|nr:aminodeoxychorismate synthase component I [Pontibacillus halophilus]KGX91326.1 para-aminobenzoate synthase [Pontibacillus halophilus JSM 076056 = DSM 19796]
MPSNPELYFEFADKEGNLIPRQFQNPVAVIEVKKVHDIEAAFTRIEQYVVDGYYAAGYVAYEAAPAFDHAFQVNQQEEGSAPLMWFGIFNEPVHERLSMDETASYEVKDWSIDVDYESYNDRIQKVKQAIEAGDTYQLNYTTRLRTLFKGNARAFFQQLHANQQASYSAYLDLGSYQVLSASPELFFHKYGDQLVTKPMKGTIKRGTTLQEDNRLKDELYHSEKNRSENLMIVDLLRNDVGRMATPGSVKVPKLFSVETYPTVHQMTSTITGTIDPDIELYQLFKNLFPCGSITGAPKVKTMEYIASLEESKRQVYCGAIGFITPEREAIFNVPIRTVLIDSTTGIAEYGSGGGITWESTSHGEYEELYTKAKLLSEQRPDFRILESIRWDGGVYQHIHLHMQRMEDSARYFGYPFQSEKFIEALTQFSQQLGSGPYKIRLTLSREGEFHVEAEEIKAEITNAKCARAKFPVPSNDPFLYHKTTYRHVYNVHKENAPSDAFSVLLWNERHEITEFTIGNVVLQIDGHYYTPPIQSGLLGGVYRKKLLDEGTIEEKTLYVTMLEQADSIWMINAVRGWVKVSLSGESTPQ